MKKFNFQVKAIILGLFLITYFTGTLFAQENVNDLLNKKISLDAEDATISYIITTMAVLSDCNIVLAMGYTDGEEADEEQQDILDLGKNECAASAMQKS